MYRCTDADAENTVYTLQREKVFAQGNADAGVIPRIVYFNKSANVVCV